jgi:hypothetical protein
VSFVAVREEKSAMTGITMTRAYGPFGEQRHAWNWLADHPGCDAVTNTRVVPLVGTHEKEHHGH